MDHAWKRLSQPCRGAQAASSVIIASASTSWRCWWGSPRAWARCCSGWGSMPGPSCSTEPTTTPCRWALGRAPGAFGILVRPGRSGALRTPHGTVDVPTGPYAHWPRGGRRHLVDAPRRRHYGTAAGSGHDDVGRADDRRRRLSRPGGADRRAGRVDGERHRTGAATAQALDPPPGSRRNGRWDRRRLQCSAGGGPSSPWRSSSWASAPTPSSSSSWPACPRLSCPITSWERRCRCRFPTWTCPATPSWAGSRCWASWAGASASASCAFGFIMLDALTRAWQRLGVPIWARPGTGGLAVGAVLLILPEMYGESSATLNRALAGRYALTLLLVLCVAKMITTSLTLGMVSSAGCSPRPCSSAGRSVRPSVPS